MVNIYIIMNRCSRGQGRRRDYLRGNGGVKATYRTFVADVPRVRTYIGRRTIGVVRPPLMTISLNVFHSHTHDHV